MAYEQKPNRGTLFKNDKKTTEMHPDFKGDFNIDGVNYWISAWKKDGKYGTFLSISVEKKKAPDVMKMADKNHEQLNHRRSEPQHDDNSFGDDIPF